MMNSKDEPMDDRTKQVPIEETTVIERDMISTLHESILGHILSFLPIIETVRTCVLSTRWVDVWTLITNLHFDDSFNYFDKKMDKQQFVNFVEKVFLHFTTSSIKSFSLCLTCYQYDASLINEWISFILERRVQKFHIQYANKLFLPSKSLFSCNSLVELVLQGRFNLTLPVLVCLPNLENIKISGIKLVSDFDSSNYSKDITLSFPILKVFEARGCEWSTMQNISLQVPLLERFSLAIWNHHSNESCKSTIKVYSSCLTDFSYEGDLEQEILLCDSSSIRNASVVIVIDEDKKDRMEKDGFRTCKLLRQISEVERLKLLFYKVLRHASDIFTNLPVFGKLTYLQLNEVTGEALLQLLHNSPILNTLVLLNGVSNLNKVDLTSVMVPHCFLSSFKVFQFKGFNANECDLCLVKFMMANATTLEKMTISPAFWMRYADIDFGKVKEEILSLPKCSSFCMIEFSNISSC